jgi:hypothetical protein
MSQGQDAKLFQRGKIQVRSTAFNPLTSLLMPARDSTGVPSRTARGGEQGQKVHEKEDSLEEDRGKYHHGQRQLVPFVPILVSTQVKLTNRRFRPVSPLFTDVVQCLGTPLLEIKKSCVDSTWGSARRADPQSVCVQWSTCFSSVTDGRNLTRFIWSFRVSYRHVPHPTSGILLTTLVGL